MGELPQQVGVNLATLERLNDQLRLNGEQQLRVLEQRERLLEGLSPAEPGAPPSTAATLAPTESFEEKSLEQMKQDLQQAEARFMAKHPDVIRLKEQVAALEKEVETRQAERRALESSEKGPEPPRTVPAARRRALENINTELERLKKAEADAREIIVSTERRLEGVPARQQEFQLLSRDHQAAKEQYDSLMKRYDEAQLTESMEVDRQGERFRILEPALAPDGPTAPNRPRLLILGFLFAVAAAGAAVLLAEQFDTSFHSVDDLRSFTRIPVLASIPHVGPASGTRLAFTAASALAVIALVAVLSARVASGNEQLVRLLVRAS